jgi:hypothetical protein
MAKRKATNLRTRHKTTATQSLVKKKLSKREEKLQRYAFHEAGHAVLACLLRQPFEYVSIEPDDKSRGRIALQRSNIQQKKSFVERNGKFRLQTVGPSHERRVEKLLLILVAGFAAETAFLGESDESKAGATADYDFSFKQAMILWKDEDLATDYIDFIQERMPDIISNFTVRTTIYSVACELFRVRRLSAKQVRESVRAWTDHDKTGEYKKFLKPKKFHPNK